MRCIVDAQLPKRVSILLNELGVDAIHTLDLPGGNRTSDEMIIKISEEDQRIVITKDNDFLQNHLLHGRPPKLLMVNTGNINNNLLLHLFRVNLPFLVEQFKATNHIELTKAEIIVHD